MTEVVKEGVVEWQKKGKLSGKKWNVVYAVITPGGLHIFKDANDLYPSKSINVESAFHDPPFEKDKVKCCFGIKTGDGTFIFSVENDTELSAWTAALKEASGKKMTLPPKKTTTRSSSSLLFRAKKNISGKVATSSLMKQKILNDETRSLLDAMVAVVERVTDNKTAAGVEKQIIKMVLKGYFQYDKGAITLEDFRKVDGVLRRAFNQVDKLFAYYQVRPAAQLTEGFSKTAAMLEEASKGVIGILGPHVRAENIAKMREALAVISNADFLFKVWDCPALEQNLLSLISAMNKYTQIELN